jgi:hypothetical protein
MACSFLEMDTGKMNLKQIKAKYRRYAAWGLTETGRAYLTALYRTHGAADPRPNFRVLFVAHDRDGTGGDARAISLIKLALPVPIIRDRLWLTTVAALREHQHDPVPLGAAIWRCGRDATPKYISVTQLGRQQQHAQKMTLDQLPLHMLFPVASTLPEGTTN